MNIRAAANGTVERMVGDSMEEEDRYKTSRPKVGSTLKECQAALSHHDIIYWYLGLIIAAVREGSALL